MEFENQVMIMLSGASHLRRTILYVFQMIQIVLLRKYNQDNKYEDDNEGITRIDSDAITKEDEDRLVPFGCRCPIQLRD